MSDLIPLEVSHMGVNSANIVRAISAIAEIHFCIFLSVRKFVMTATRGKNSRLIRLVLEKERNRLMIEIKAADRISFGLFLSIRIKNDWEKLKVCC